MSCSSLLGAMKTASFSRTHQRNWCREGGYYLYLLLITTLLTVHRALVSEFKPIWRPQAGIGTWRLLSNDTSPNLDEAESHRWFIVRNHIKAYPVSSHPSICRNLMKAATQHAVFATREALWQQAHDVNNGFWQRTQLWMRVLSFTHMSIIFSCLF